MEAPTLSHYHRVDTFLWYDVVRTIQRLCVSSMECAAAEGGAPLTLSEVDLMLDFLHQMEFAYVHPRRSSARVRLYMCGRHAAANRLAYPQTKKNLSNHEKTYGRVCV